jgi:hypothetical protein
MDNPNLQMYMYGNVNIYMNTLETPPALPETPRTSSYPETANQTSYPETVRQTPRQSRRSRFNRAPGTPLTQRQQEYTPLFYGVPQGENIVFDASGTFFSYLLEISRERNAAQENNTQNAAQNTSDEPIVRNHPPPSSESVTTNDPIETNRHSYINMSTFRPRNTIFPQLNTFMDGPLDSTLNDPLEAIDSSGTALPRRTENNVQFLLDTLRHLIEAHPETELMLQVEDFRDDQNYRDSISTDTSVSLLLNNTTVEIAPSEVVANETICAICQNAFTSHDIVRTINQCGHYFHIQCAERWLSTHTSCPMCRNNIG